MQNMQKKENDCERKKSKKGRLENLKSKWSEYAITKLTIIFYVIVL